MMLQDMTLILTKASSRSCCKLVSLCHVVFTGPSNFDQGAALQVELVAPSLVRSYCVRDLCFFRMERVFHCKLPLLALRLLCLMLVCSGFSSDSEA